LILVCLAQGEAPDVSAVADGLKPFLQLHGIAGARLAEQQHFPVQANWKLALENYLECYHCKPAHPQYSRVEIKVEKIGDGSPAAMARYQARNAEWVQAASELGTLLPDFAALLPLDASLPRAQLGAAYRAPLRAGYLSATEDGRPAAPLMGAFTDYDGGETALALGPFTYMLASNDHAVFFQFVPLDEVHSNMIVSWLVRADARETADYDLSRLTWLWNVTTLQDKTIIEANSAGVLSRHYEPGPASLLEQDLTGFRNWYLALIGPGEALGQLKRNDKGRYFGL
jgi:Rieske 2Fe-2S family protein